ncbi:MAG: hypothetical protein MUF22_07440 [Chitinispirillaceae bacterium]|nr:hypothetical protein [Chitinispirillaceae bacterium]
MLKIKSTLSQRFALLALSFLITGSPLMVLAHDTGHCPAPCCSETTTCCDRENTECNEHPPCTECLLQFPENSALSVSKHETIRKLTADGYRLIKFPAIFTKPIIKTGSRSLHSADIPAALPYCCQFLLTSVLRL